MPEQTRPTDDPMPLTATWLFRTGTRAWLAIGVILVVVGVLAMLGTLSSVVGPLTVAALVGILLSPVVDRLHKLRVPRSVGSALVLVALVVVAAWSMWLTVTAVVEQGSEIARALSRAFASLDQWLTDLDADLGIPVDSAGGLQDALRDAV